MDEYLADTDPRDPDSMFRIRSIKVLPHGVELRWQGGAAVTQYIERATSVTGEWTVFLINYPPTQVYTNCVDEHASEAQFYRIRTNRK